mgnify:CR=1 FL=1
MFSLKILAIAYVTCSLITLSFVTIEWFVVHRLSDANKFKKWWQKHVVAPLEEPTEW